MTIALNINAFALDASTGNTEDPKKADEALVNKSAEKKLSLEEKRNALKAKHQAKKEAKAAAKAKTAAANTVSADASQASVDPLKDTRRDEKIQEIREETAPKK